jgi:hypothetical protein
MAIAFRANHLGVGQKAIAFEEKAVGFGQVAIPLGRMWTGPRPEMDA